MLLLLSLSLLSTVVHFPIRPIQFRYVAIALETNEQAQQKCISTEMNSTRCHCRKHRTHTLDRKTIFIWGSDEWKIIMQRTVWMETAIHTARRRRLPFIGPRSSASMWRWDRRKNHVYPAIVHQLYKYSQCVLVVFCPAIVGELTARKHTTSIFYRCQLDRCLLMHFICSLDSFVSPVPCFIQSDRKF